MKRSIPGAEALVAQLKAGVARVLIVDDDLHICQGLTDILQDAGYQVETANCAAEAREILDMQTFAVLVVDYALPDANGMEIARMVRVRYPWLQTLLMTGHDRVEIAKTDENEPLLAAFLRKPIDVRTILSAIEQTLNRQCDHFAVPRFSLQPESSPALFTPKKDEKPAPSAASAPDPAASSKNRFALAMVVPVLLLGFAAGWYSRGRIPLQKAIVQSPVSVPKEIPAPVQQPPKVKAPAPVPAKSSVTMNPPRPAAAPAPKPPVIAREPSETPKPAPPDWNSQLESDDVTVRLGAAKALLKSQPENSKALSTLLMLLEDPDSSHRREAIEALSVSGVATQPVVEALARRLRDEDPEVALAAASTLARAGDAAIPALPDLIDAMSGSSATRVPVEKMAQSAIVRIGGAAVPALIGKLADSQMRAQVVETLGAIGPAAEEAMPALTALEDDPQVGIAVMRATAKIEPETP